MRSWPPYRPSGGQRRPQLKQTSPSHRAGTVSLAWPYGTAPFFRMGYLTVRGAARRAWQPSTPGDTLASRGPQSERADLPWD